VILMLNTLVAVFVGMKTVKRLCVLLIFGCFTHLIITNIFVDKRLVTYRHYNISNDHSPTVHAQVTPDMMRSKRYNENDLIFTYDVQLIDYIRSEITPPSPAESRQLLRPHRKDRSQFGQSKFVDKLLSGLHRGFFVECGAADGEKYSNSLFFELERNWTGILIEANPDYHSRILNKKRHAYVLQACLSTEKRPMKLGMQPAGVLGGLVNTMHRSHLHYIGRKRKREITVNCFPLNAIMTAINVTHVDYLSLDVEGAELEILRTIQWTQLKIDVITVEYYIHRNRAATLTKLEVLRQFFNDTGIYREKGVLPRRRPNLSRCTDVVFMREYATS